MSDDQYIQNALNALASTVVDKAPYFGSLPLNTDAFKIYFEDKNGQAHSINTPDATDAQMSILAGACSIAPFGRGAEAVVDDTYRKAGKLDLPRFAIPFEPETTALVAGIRESMLEGAAAKRPIRFELYKLNVYGEGGFFKAHKDTPRGATMFGSLVLVYPTTHAGGALVFRHQGREWLFDSAASTTQDGAPAFGYAAFFSDVEHEVLPVTSGYRVTVTYNLYFDDTDNDTRPPGTVLSSNEDSAFAAHLQTLLDDPQFLPGGGYLGFGLHHAYPIRFSEKFYPEESGVQHLLDVLKGADVTVLRAARAAGLSTQLHVAYDTQINVEPGYQPREVVVLATEVMGGNYLEGSLYSELKQYYNGTLLWPKGHKKYRADREVHWVTPRTGETRFKSVLIAYGNDPSLDYSYGELCLLVAVGPSGARTVKENLTGLDRGDWRNDTYAESDFEWSGVDEAASEDDDDEDEDEDEEGDDED